MTDGVADPDFEDVPTEELISKDYADERRDEIDPSIAKAYEPGDFGSTSADANYARARGRARR